MSVPSIKGTTFQKVAEDLLGLVEKGRLSREQVEARLEPEDLEWLEAKIAPTDWIPIQTYARMAELLCSIEAPGRLQSYMVRRGRESAERLAALGIYSQLDATTEHVGRRIGRMIVTVAGLIFNFGQWSYKVEEDGEEAPFTLRVEDVAPLPEVARFAIEGFTEFVATRATGADVRVTSERPSPDLVLFRGCRVS